MNFSLNRELRFLQNIIYRVHKLIYVRTHILLQVVWKVTNKAASKSSSIFILMIFYRCNQIGPYDWNMLLKIATKSNNERVNYEEAALTDFLTNVPHAFD